MKRRREEGEKEAKKITPSDMAGAMLSAESYWQNVLVGSMFSNFKPPVDEGTRDVFKVEFDRLYGEFRAWGADADKARDSAAKRMATIWGASETTGQIMRRPPERYHKPIDGSHAWMRDALQKDIAAIIGDSAMDDPVGERFSWEARIIPDARTESDIASGRPPSYMVAVTDTRTGMTDLLMTDLATGMDTRAPENTFVPGTTAVPLRYHFNDADAVSQGQTSFDAAAAAMRARERQRQGPFQSIMSTPTGVKR